MKKIYMTPIASFEEMENEVLMFETSSIKYSDRTQDPPKTSDVEVNLFDNPADPSQGGGMSEVVSGETDD